MSTKRFRGGMAALVLLAVLMAQAPFAQPSQPMSQSLLMAEPHPKLETTLQVLAEQYDIAPLAARSFADTKAIDLVDDFLTVVIEPLEGRVDSVDSRGIERFGGRITRISDRLVQASLPLGALVDIADSVSGIAYMRLPYRPRALVVSEGVAVIGASDYHSAGYEGQGTKVAVIDLGFAGANALPGELPTVVAVDYTGTGVYTGISHGTAVAEIVADVAPQTSLYLLKISDEVELSSAVSYCITNGIDVIVHSVGWYNTCFYDGTGVVASVANNARDNGILWVNAAGNEAADGHWQGAFFDGDTDGGPGLRRRIRLYGFP